MNFINLASRYTEKGTWIRKLKIWLYDYVYVSLFTVRTFSRKEPPSTFKAFIVEVISNFMYHKSFGQ